ncbi:MAG: CSLREA domain-containing protein, partial [Anaerolineales bacterium]
MRRTRPIFTLIVLVVAMSLSGCTLLDDIFGGLAAVCEQPELVVTKTADTNDGLCSADDCSLREAVITSNDCPGEDTIRIPAGVYRLTRTGADEEEARRGDLDLRDDVIILGDPSRTTPDSGEAEVVEIRGEGADRIFDIAPARDFDRTSPLNVVIQRVIVREGRADRGAGILNRGNLRLVLVSMMNNQAALPDGVGGEANGGGLYNQDSGQLHFDNVSFNNNRADNGAGLYMQSGSAVGDEIAITENSAAGDGGGIYLRTGSRTELTNVDFIHNQAGGNGGGVFSDSEFDGQFLLFEENSAEGQGGGLFNGSSALALLDNTHFTLNLGGQGGGLFNAGRTEVSRSSINQNRAFDHQGGGIANIRSSLASESGVVP